MTIKSVVDSDGKVWKGSEVDTSPSLGESLVTFIATGGISALYEAVVGGDDSTTVEVNGVQHTGREI